MSIDSREDAHRTSDEDEYGSRRHSPGPRPRRPRRLQRVGYYRLVIGVIGAICILNGFEVADVGSVASRMDHTGSGIAMNASFIGDAGTLYLLGLGLGALISVWMVRRLGRRRPVLVALGIYVLATAASAFAFAAWFFDVCRFVTGLGVGGTFVSLALVIQELIPRRRRARVARLFNGSYWMGALTGSVIALFFVAPSIFPFDIGWRLSFGFVAVIGLAVLLLARRLPDGALILDRRGLRPVRPGRVARVALREHPRRSGLALALLAGQTFIFYGVAFDLGPLLSRFEAVPPGSVPIFVLVFAAANLAGALLLARALSPLGRRRMAATAHIGSAAILALLAILFAGGALSRWGVELMLVAVFLLASSAGSAAYTAAARSFATADRASGVAFLYAIGTGLGGVLGPLAFGHLIDSGNRGVASVAFWISAGMMALGGVAQLFLARRTSTPAGTSTTQQPNGVLPPEAEGRAEQPPDGWRPAGRQLGRRRALAYRHHAEEAPVRAAVHRLRAHQLRAGSGAGAGRIEHRGDGAAGAEEALARISELRAEAMEVRAQGWDERRHADATAQERDRTARLARARAATARAEAMERQADALAMERRVNDAAQSV